MPLTTKTHARVLVEKLLDAAKNTNHILTASEYYDIKDLLTALDISRKEYEDARNEEKRNYPVRSTFVFRGGLYQITPGGPQYQYGQLYEHIIAKMLNDAQKDIANKLLEERFKTDKVRLNYLGLEK